MSQVLFFHFFSLSHQSPIWDGIIFFFANDLPYIIFALVCFVIISLGEKTEHSKLRFLIQITLATIITLIITIILKNGIGEPRPYQTLSITPLFYEGFNNSFPSGHSSVFFTIALSIFFLNKKVGLVFIFLALLIVTARVISGVHYPSDIVYGFIIAFSVSYWVNNLLTKIIYRFEKKITFLGKNF